MIGDVPNVKAPLELFVTPNVDIIMESLTFMIFYQFHVVCTRVRWVDRRESGHLGIGTPFSSRHLRSSLSAEFWRHGVLSGGTQRRVLPRYQTEQ